MNVLLGKLVQFSLKPQNSQKIYPVKLIPYTIIWYNIMLSMCLQYCDKYISHLYHLCVNMSPLYNIFID